MKAILVALVLAAGAGPSMAEWVKVATVGRDTHYIQTPVMAGSGHWVKAWEMLDYGEAQDRRGKKVLSARSLVEFDCASQNLRLLALVFHAGNMGAGDPVQFANVDPKWEPANDTFLQAFWKVACGKP